MLPDDPEGVAWRILSAKRLTEAYSNDEDEYDLQQIENKQA
jgi:hypothetical protein